MFSDDDYISVRGAWLTSESDLTRPPSRGEQWQCRSAIAYNLMAARLACGALALTSCRTLVPSYNAAQVAPSMLPLLAPSHSFFIR